MELEPLDIEKNSTKRALENEVCESIKHEKRAKWGNRMEFVLALIGFTVGIGRIWRFSILCARNGTGAFLIPFVIFMIACGFPLYYIEVSLGQFCGKSAGLAFEFCPLFKGELKLSECLSLIKTVLLVSLIYSMSLIP